MCTLNFFLEFVLYSCVILKSDAESSSTSNGNSGIDGSSASGGDESCNIVIGGAGGKGGDNNSNDGNDGNDGMYHSGTGGITIQPLACQSSAARSIF